jgi:hypothetical protein
MFAVVRLSGLGLENPKARPVRADICFETTGDKRLGITIPFAGDAAMEATVDTKQHRAVNHADLFVHSGIMAVQPCC